MPVQINEVIIRAIITNDEKKSAPAESNKTDDKKSDQVKSEVLELIDEVLKNKKER
jgi:uncharacterized protein DUF5908